MRTSASAELCRRSVNADSRQGFLSAPSVLGRINVRRSAAVVVSVPSAKSWCVMAALSVSGSLDVLPAWAVPPDPTPTAASAATPPTTDSARMSYRWQIALADLAGLASGITFAATRDGGERGGRAALGRIGVGWYGVGAVLAPAIHFAHDRADLGAQSLALRTVQPPLLWLLGIVGGCIGDDDCDARSRRAGATGGTLVGLAAAAAVDIAVLAPTVNDTTSPVPTTPARHWYG
jgi:hypothetical protein